MEGAIFLIFKLVVFTSLVGMVATVRFLLWSQSKAKRGAIDLLLLFAACFGCAFPLLGLITWVVRGFETDLVRTGAIVMPLIATVLAQAAMYVGMGGQRKRDTAPSA